MLFLAFRYLFSTAGPFIRLFSIATGACVRLLEGHTAEVTGLALNPSNSLQVLDMELCAFRLGL